MDLSLWKHVPPAEFIINIYKKATNFSALLRNITRSLGLRQSTICKYEVWIII